MEQILLYREARRERFLLSLFTKYAEEHIHDLHLILPHSKPQALPAASIAGESVGHWMKFTISKQAITVRIFFYNCSPFKKTILTPFLIIKRGSLIESPYYLNK